MAAASVTCPSGHHNPEHHHFCGECGAALPVSCPNGHRNPPHSHFCGECGTALGESARAHDTLQDMAVQDRARTENNPSPDIPATSAAATPPPRPSGHRTGPKLKPLIALLGICLIVVGFLYAIPIFLTIGLIVLIVGLVLMATGRRGRATPAAAGALSATNPAPHTPATPQPDETRSGKKLFAVIAAGLVAVVVLGPVAAKYLWPSIYKVYCSHIVATCRDYSPSSPSSGSPGSPQSQSPFYQEGYNSGTSGLARKGYGDNMANTGATVAEMEHQACASAINSESNYSSLLEPTAQDNYMDGCLNAFRDHPPTGKPKSGPLNPYR